MHALKVATILLPALIFGAGCAATAGGTSRGGGGNGGGASEGGGDNNASGGSAPTPGTGGGGAPQGPLSTVAVTSTGSGEPAVVGPCDNDLAIDSDDPMDAARAIGLCDSKQIVSAKYVTADGDDLKFYDPEGIGHGILPNFGASVVPREGARMLVLSSGAARAPNHPDYEPPSGFNKHYTTGAPDGYPKESPSCEGVTTGEPHDSVALELELVPPKGAKSISFRSYFFTFEFPNYICDEYNDFFVAMLSPRPQGLPDDNIAFDAKGNSISVNAGFLEVCTPQTAGGKKFACALGPKDLNGTGFEKHAATGWLATAAPIPAEHVLKLRFAIWDSGDGILDSTVLIDDFRWEGVEVTTETKPDVPK